MNVLQILALAYLSVGIVYAVIVLLFGQDVWYWFPFNVLLGPINLLYLVYFTWSGKELSKSFPTNVRLIDGKKAVVFDLDGTIVDTEELWHKALYKVITTADNTIEDSIITLTETGMTLKDRWSSVFTYYPDIKAKIGNIDEAVKQTENCFLSSLKETSLKPKSGFWNILTEFKGTHKMKVGLTTNTNKEVVNAVLAQMNMSDVFDFILCGSDVSKPKPDKEMYVKAAQKFGVKPEQMLVFEDSSTGIKSALDAGSTVVMIRSVTLNKDVNSQKAVGPFEDFNSVLPILGKTYKQYKGEIVDKGIPVLAAKLKEIYATSTSTTSTN